MEFEAARRLSRLIFYIAAILCAVVAWKLQQHYIGTPQWPADGIISSSETDLSSWEAKGIEAASQMNSLLTTLGTAMLGAMGFLLINIHSAHHRPRHLWSALASAVCVGASIYFGYVGYMHVLGATASHRFNPYDQLIKWPSQAQFYMLLLAVFFFADFTFHELTRKEKEA